MYEYFHGNIPLHTFISVQSISAQPKIYFPFLHNQFFYLLAKACCTNFFISWTSASKVSTNKLIILSLKQDSSLPLNLPIYVKDAVLGLCSKGQKLNWTKCNEMTGVGVSKASGYWNLILELLQHPSHTLQSGLILT